MAIKSFDSPAVQAIMRLQAEVSRSAIADSLGQRVRTGAWGWDVSCIAWDAGGINPRVEALAASARTWAVRVAQQP